MASLAEQIKLLANPEPTSFDPEGDEFSSTRARVTQRDTNDEDDEDNFDHSALRRGNAPLLEEEDSKYGGRRVSRAELATMRGDFQDSDGSEDESLGDSGKALDSSSENEEDVKESQEILDKNRNTTNKLPKVEILQLNGDNHDNSDDDDNDAADDDDSEDESDDDNDSENDEDLSGKEEGGVQNFSTPNMTEEFEKGKAVKTQLNLWDSFLEYRIRVQKALVVANKLPQCMDMEKFVSSSDNNLAKADKQGKKSMSQLLYKLLLLQEKLLEQNPETKKILYPGLQKKTTVTDSDEEIPSDSDEEKKDSDKEEESMDIQASESLKLPVKRKAELTNQEFEECISKRHAAFQSYRDSTISKWGEKTRLASGKLNSKGFSSFDRSALSQIKQIMSDKPRLVKRTQLKRSSYRVLGKMEKEPILESDGKMDAPADAHLKDYDPQVFDDDDFYHQLLRELIERRTTTSTDDPIETGRQWLELQKLRRKIKKKVDTKASKGRKIRYNVHAKLVSYMAPIDRGTMPDSSRNELFSSLFGQHPSQPTGNASQGIR